MKPAEISASGSSSLRHLEKPLLFLLDFFWSELCSNPVFLSSSPLHLKHLPPPPLLSSSLFLPLICRGMPRHLGTARECRCLRDASGRMQWDGSHEDPHARLGWPWCHWVSLRCQSPGLIAHRGLKWKSVLLSWRLLEVICMYIEKNLVSLLVPICLFILRLSGPCSRNSHFLNVR